jgi:hypothetical protein
MSIGNIGSFQQIGYNRSFTAVNNYQNQPVSNFSKIYQADYAAFNSIQPKLVSDQPFNQEPPTGQPSFFNRPEVRLAAMSLGAGLAVGAVGAAIGAAAGNMGLGIAIGAGVGIIAPIAMIVYAISKMD